MASFLLVATVRADLKILDRPLYIFPGQTFRIALEQPKGSGKLDVNVPPTLKMFDTWPKDSIQRFYFRALKPGDATLSFRGKAGALKVPLEVMPWTEVFRPRKLEKFDLPRIWPVGEADYEGLKKRRTFYTKEELKAKRDSKAKPSKFAQQWAEMSDEDIWNIIPGPCVPRTCLIVLSGRGREDGRGKGCPVCGMKVYKGRSAFYPWKFDPKNHPWKVGCPSCGNWFPSNDWHKGDMHSGPFPDDGYGCEPVKPILSPSGTPWRWPFIAYYHQWIAYMRTFTPGAKRCAEAFARTGDKRYAHKTAIALFRYAESMLDMAVNLKHRKMAYRDAILRWPVGAPVLRKRLAGTFLYIQPNWDTPRMEGMARAWDLIFDQIDGDEDLITFCQAHHHPEIKTAEDFRRFVEAGVIRVPLQAALDNAVARNYPMQEVMIATMALVMDSPRSLDLVDYLLNEGANMRFALANQFFKDGSAHESEGYNGIQIRDIERMADLFERIRQLYPGEWEKRGLISLYDDPKYRLMYDFVLDNSLIGRTIPRTGDTGRSARAPTDPQRPMQGYPCRPENFIPVFKRTRDPRFAQAIYGPVGKVPSVLTDPELRTEVEKVGKERGWEVKLKSTILDGYGHAILRSGSGDRQRALWLRYGRVIQHAHPDMLTMGLAALKRDLLPEMGYPQGWTYARHWATNWGTHYGTKIVGVSTWNYGRGHVTLFAATPPAQVVSATSELLPGKQKATRSRTIVLVDLSDRDCYAVTLENVLGGEEHIMSFHGPDGDATPHGVELTPQKKGTVLGPDVRYGDYSSVEKVDRDLSCLAFMYDVRCGKPKGVWDIDYLLRSQKDVHLRATMIAPADCELALAKGKPPQGRKSYEITWAILKRKGAAPLASQFATVIEPYEGKRLIQKVEYVGLGGPGEGPFRPVGIRVTSKEFVDTIILQPEKAVDCITPDGIECNARFGFWRERGGTLAAAVLAAGTHIRKDRHGIALSEAAYVGKVKSCDWPNRALVIEPRPGSVDALPGRHVRIRNDTGNDVSYLIQKAEATEGGCRITLRFDPRVGEGVVKDCADGRVVTGSTLRLYNWRYYAGKALSNEDGSVLYRLSDVAKAAQCIVDRSTYGTVKAETLRSQFADKDGDGRARFIIYDYGPGDDVIIQSCAGLVKE